MNNIVLKQKSKSSSYKTKKKFRELSLPAKRQSKIFRNHLIICALFLKLLILFIFCILTVILSS